MSSDVLISSNDLHSGRLLARAWGGQAITLPAPSFDQAATAAHTSTMIVSHVRLSYGEEASLAIQSGLRHHASWLRAVELLDSTRREDLRCITVTELVAHGEVVAASTAQLVRAIGTDYDQPARHLCLETTSSPDRIVTVIKGMLDAADRWPSLPLLLTDDALVLRSDPTARASIVLSPGWTPTWLEAAVTQR